MARAGLLCLIAGAAAAAPAPPNPATPVRVGDHPGFGRVVFDLPPEATSHVVVEGARVLMVFQGAGAVLQPGDLPRNVRTISTGADTATLELAPGARARPVRIGDRLVIDVLDPGPSSSTRPAASTARPAAPRPAATRPSAQPPPEPTPQAAAAVPPAPPATTPAAAMPPAALPPVTLLPALPPPEPPSAAPAPAVVQEPLPATLPGQAAPETKPFFIKADSDVGAAAFRRGEYGVIVLDRRLAAQPVPQGAVWTRGVRSTVLQLPVPPDTALRMTRSGDGWTVDQLPGWRPDALPQRLLGTGLAFDMTRPSRMVAVLDPVSGGTLLVGTASAAEGGVPGGQRTADFRVLPTWLGVVLEPSSDQVDLRPAAAGYVVTGGSPATVLAAEAPSRRFDFPNEPAQALANRLRAQLASAATMAPRSRSTERLAAAQTMIALGMGAEAQALLQQLAADDPQQAGDAQTAGLAAIAAMLAGRFEEAAALDDPRLDGSGEIDLWRGLRDLRLGADSDAARRLGGAAPLALAYPPSLQRLVLADVAEAAVNSGIAMPAEALPPFAKALLLERKGDVDGALSAYDALAVAPDRLTQVRATAQATELRLAAARIGPAAASAIMERQSYGWRGDRLEYQLRLRAAELKAAAQEWRPALESLRAIEAAFPDRKPAIQRRKVDVMQAMLTAEGAGLTPLDLVLLAADYQDCVPEGPGGSVMARLLADKLAALDLPARTIPVLQGLVRATEAGEARAEFGVHLGELLFDGGDAAAALAALDASAAPDLPPALHERRQLLLARSREKGGNLAAAVAGLVELGTERADDMRAAMLAKAGDWRGAVSALNDLVDKQVPNEGPLSGVAQELLIRQADAAARAEMPTVLQKLRLSASRLEGARADVFRLLTAPRLDSPADLPRAGLELAAAQGMPQRIQAAKLR